MQNAEFSAVPNGTSLVVIHVLVVAKWAPWSFREYTQL